MVSLGKTSDGDLNVDLDKLVETRLLIEANSGGGKSWCIRKLLEESHGKIQQIVIDMEGEFHTLREKFDYILAGKEGDIPVDLKTAALLAKKILELKASIIIDLYELKHHDRIRFVKLFLDSMINAPKELWHPVMVIIDEAHVFCPEKGESEAMGSVIDLATRGRKRGFMVVLATQRLSKLHKDAAAEMNNKIIGRTTLDIDMKRASEELGFTSKVDMLGLRDLDAGEFYAFGPAISKTIVKIKIGAVQTTHPKIGQRVVEVPKMTENVKNILSKLTDLPQEAERDLKDKQEISKRIRELEAELRRKPVPAVVENTKLVDKYRQIADDLKQKVADLSHELQAYKTLNRKLASRLEQIGKILEVKIEVPQVAVWELSSGKKTTDHYSEQKKQAISPTKTEVPVSRLLDERGMGLGERKVLTAIAQYPDGVARDSITVLTGYKRSTRDAYIQRLALREDINISGNFIYATQKGIDELGEDFKPLPVGAELREHLMNTLPEGERKILGVLFEKYPEAVERDKLGEDTGFKRSTRDAYLQRLNARQLVAFEGKGMVKASEKLFSE